MGAQGDGNRGRGRVTGAYAVITWRQFGTVLWWIKDNVLRGSKAERVFGLAGP